MTPEEIVNHVEIDMKEGGLEYQPAYWKTKLLVRIKALVEAKNIEKQRKDETSKMSNPCQ